MRKQDIIELSSNLANAPSMCAITTRMMQIPVVRSTKTLRIFVLSTFICFLKFTKMQDIY